MPTKRNNQDTNSTNKSQEGSVDTNSKSTLKKSKTTWNWTTIRLIITTLGTLIGIAIGAFQAIQINKIQVERDKEITSLKVALDSRDAQILDLQAKLDESNKEILTLRDQITIPPLKDVLSQEGKVQFEWQWTGENWYGRVALGKQANNYVITQAKVGLLEKNIEDRYLMNGQVLNLAPNTQGTFEIINNSVIRIEMPVMKKNRRNSEIRMTTIQGALKQTLCYAGRVGYSDGGGLYRGDIVLVDLDYAPIYGSQLDDWFSNEQGWVEEYYVDRDK